MLEHVASEALPTLSIVIPSFNQGAYIERTIRSILDQNYPRLELILMDGGSTDETMQIVSRYAHHFAVIKHEKDDGQSDAIARGFELATCKYISWLNSDDTYVDGALLRVGKYLSEHPEIHFIYGNTNYIDCADNMIAHKRQPAFNLGIMKYAYLTVSQMSAFWSKELYTKVGGLDKTLQFCMDYDLFVKMAIKNEPIYINETIGNFRIHSQSKTSNLELVRRREDAMVQARYCRIKPSQKILFSFTRSWYLLILIFKFARNGSLYDRLRRRIQNRMSSDCS